MALATANDRERAVLLAQAAREHKREEARQRRQARAAMQELTDFCKRAGIDVVEIRTEAEGHGPAQEDSTA